MSALDRPISITFFRSHTATTKGEARYTPRELAARIRTTTAGRKDDLPWLKLAKFGNRRSRPKPDGTAGNSLRWDGNVLAITGIEADYDGGQISVDEALNALTKQGIASLVYTSPSFTEDRPRWRVLCPLSAEAPPDQRRHLVGRLNGLFRGIFANESWTLSQSYYFGSVRNNSSHRVELVDGTSIDLHDDLDECWIGPPGSVKGTTTAEAGKDARETCELVRLILTGEHYHCELRALAARMIGQNVPAGIVSELLRGFMLASSGVRDERWTDRYDSIDELVTSAVKKYQAGARIRRDNNSALCALAIRLFEQRHLSGEVREALHAEAARLGINDNFRIEDILQWAAEKELARRTSSYA
jgi:hypothetical protein